MISVGGNTIADVEIIQTTKNGIGENVKTWKHVDYLTGWLDYSDGEARSSTYEAKVADATHLFIAEYKPLPKSVTDETARIVIDGKRYAVKMIDDPMNLHEHYEIYLKYTGGQ